MAAPDRPSTATRPPAGGPTKGSDKSLPELGKELLDLSVTYAKQETLDPLRTLGRRVGLGVLGSAVASVGLVFLLVGVLRLVQVEARLRGAWSWVPYLAAIVVAGIVAALSFRQIGGGRGR
jgi:hypothetical protein